MGERFEADFRKAMRRLASAVTVVTAAHEGDHHGMTATAVTAVSDAPPSLLACVNRSAGLHDPLLASGRFCINILHADQSGIAEAFGGRRRKDERFAVGEWVTSACGLPFLREAQASIFCDVDCVTPYGSHSVVIGRISDILVAGHVAPLLYQDGRYTVGLGDGIDWVVPI
ncbi:MAG: flavin reductase [Pseudorhodoplanes sp.]|nr:4-hydroxyphenylacetate 3-monooxygenase reductase component [Pseudorhodoplanes sp.]MBW7949680.1 flavin reductase [Pseudorhodoplanes sp.]GIK79165.1 MAG: flavin oxidoreductase [Alphaproteobacteria bacterium]